jgi:hypothetical protein
VIADSVRTIKKYGGVSIESGEGLATCTAMDHAWTITSMIWEHLKSGWLGVPQGFIRKVKMDCDWQVVLESGGYRSATWRTLRVLQQVHGTEEIWDCTCVTSPPFFSQIGSPEGRSYEEATDKTVVIMWDGLNVEERESAMSWMTMSKSWVLWRQHDSSSSTKTDENATEEKLQLLLGECGWSLTGKEGKTKKGSNKNRRRMNTGDNKVSDSEYGGETQNEGWTGGSVRHKNWWHCDQVKITQSRVTIECWVSGWTVPKQEVTEAVWEVWMWESGKDEYVRTDVGPETAC